MKKGLIVLNQDLSGINRYLFTSLRQRGWEVHSVEVRPFSVVERAMTAARSFHWARPVWRARYHRALGIQARSRGGLKRKTVRCSRLLGKEARQGDVLLTFTLFSPSELRWERPYVVFKDYTVALAQRTYPEVLDVTGGALERRIALEADFCRAASLVLTASENTRRSVVQDYGVVPERVAAVGEGVCLSPLPSSPLQVRRGQEMLFVGKDFERKGGSTVLDAFARIRVQLPQAHLTVLGPARPARVPQGVEWLGLVNDRERVRSCYERASLFLMPSLCEPFGLVFLEAMVHGLPCIGSWRDAMPEIIEAGVTGFLVPPSDAEALAARCVQLLSSPDQAHRMGVEGYKRVLRLFTWERVAARIDTAFTACHLWPVARQGSVVAR